MAAYILSHMGYIAASLVLGLIVAAVIAGMVRDRKKGRSGCGCGCKGCANAPYCHPDTRSPGA